MQLEINVGKNFISAVLQHCHRQTEDSAKAAARLPIDPNLEMWSAGFEGGQLGRQDPWSRGSTSSLLPVEAGLPELMTDLTGLAQVLASTGPGLHRNRHSTVSEAANMDYADFFTFRADSGLLLVKSSSSTISLFLSKQNLDCPDSPEQEGFLQMDIFAKRCHLPCLHTIW